MGGATVSLSMILPFDSDGFVRRACPVCEREFKCIVTPATDPAPEDPTEELHCPYCGSRAGRGSWFTVAQLEQARGIVNSRVVGPMLEDLARQVRDIPNEPGALVTFTVDYTVPEEPKPLTAIDDMTRVDFPCHPDEPVKVLDGWDRPLLCHICGRRPH